MRIDGTVHCFFEQSGTFKNEFRKIGIPAEDYDVQDNFGETDHVIDLFEEIEKAYDDKPSVFDSIGMSDLVIAFFPCIYFNEMSQSAFYLAHNNYRNMTIPARIRKILERESMRSRFYRLLVKLCAVCLTKEIRLIIENPWTAPQYLNLNFLKQPTVIDNNRMKRGDYFKKPTAYWFFGCEATRCESVQDDKDRKIVLKTKSAPHAGLCSESRSMISPDYARNFIADFILGRPCSNKIYQQQEMF